MSMNEQEHKTMSQEIVRVQKSVIECDGVSDFTSEVEGEEEVNVSAQAIQGARIKYIDPRWLLGTTDITGHLFTVLGERNVATKWNHNNKPLETIILEPGQKFPDFKKLNSECDPREWREKFGKLVGPWESQHCVYFLDEAWNRYTWASPTTTVGSASAVRELMDDIKLHRKHRSRDGFPVVELNHYDFPTDYGLRQRPKLIVKRWVRFGPDRAAILQQQVTDTPAIEAPRGAPADAQPVTLQEEMGGDNVPF
jgi:hypothetical protein